MVTVKAIAARQVRRTRVSIATGDEVGQFLTATMRDTAVPMKDRIRAAIELNRIAGRHSVHVRMQEGRVTLEQVLGASREIGL